MERERDKRQRQRVTAVQFLSLVFFVSSQSLLSCGGCFHGGGDFYVAPNVHTSSLSTKAVAGRDLHMIQPHCYDSYDGGKRGKENIAQIISLFWEVCREDHMYQSQSEQKKYEAQLLVYTRRPNGRGD